MSQATSVRAPARTCPRIPKRRRREPLVDSLRAPLRARGRGRGRGR